ncbi:unnamed protein product [Heterosigma akashiwo]
MKVIFTAAVLFLLATLASAQQSLLRKQAPDFAAVAVQGEDFVDVKLEDYKGKWLVLFFYPFDFTFVCPTEIVAFSNRIDEFKGRGARRWWPCPPTRSSRTWPGSARAGRGRRGPPGPAPGGRRQQGHLQGLRRAGGGPQGPAVRGGPARAVPRGPPGEGPPPTGERRGGGANVGRDRRDAAGLPIRWTLMPGEGCPANWTPRRHH